ncbi:outer membrane beta-barrel protein [Belliella kenyensis]|uniref:Outer membrane beta-barrel protein n=1 Tax=Belliella kenyensis TaxID=1472724 RepID=A0ABV8EHR0_9BACT|nr:outer membrane beta-barrel protein [Belliella kenyensis]MCH7402437.1 porin family protein [Belliella kenyensis]MDN3603628.1 outer membrane beta-barrel protein [Belliella kenyensis]
MKKGLLVFVLLCCGFTIKAQTEKGRFLLGAGTTVGLGEVSGPMTIGFSSSKFELADGSTGEIKSSNIYLSPKVGYFVLDNLALGLDLALSFGNGKTTQAAIETESKSNLFAAGPFARYYFPGEKIRPYAEANSLFGARNQENKIGSVNIENKYSLSNIAGGLGIAILLGAKSSIDLMASYNSMKLSENESSFSNKLNTIGFKFGFTVFI